MHSRQYARTFIVGDVTAPERRVVIVVAEITMSTQSLRDEVRTTKGEGGSDVTRRWLTSPHTKGADVMVYSSYNIATFII